MARRLISVSSSADRWQKSETVCHPQWGQPGALSGVAAKRTLLPLQQGHAALYKDPLPQCSSVLFAARRACSWGSAHPTEAWVPPRDLLPQGDATYLIVTEKGEIEKYGLNAVCTHLGCVVPWNVAENKVRHGGAGRAGQAGRSSLDRA